MTSNKLPNFNFDEWCKLFGESILQYPFDVETQEIPEAPVPTKRGDHRRESVADAMDDAVPVVCCQTSSIAAGEEGDEMPAES